MKHDIFDLLFLLSVPFLIVFVIFITVLEYKTESMRTKNREYSEQNTVKEYHTTIEKPYVIYVPKTTIKETIREVPCERR
jgi:hypothetical protein